MKSLQEFYNDKDLVNNVHEYLVEYIKEKAVQVLFDKENTETYMNPDTISDAKELVDEAFENLEMLFSPTPKKSLDKGPR